MLVSPHITLASLHYQVLCPAIGYTPGTHAYAFRRIHKSYIDRNVASRNELYEDRKKASATIRKECWIGPRKSTALDIFFMPLYIGGAFADDRHILLGDIFYNQDSQTCFDLEYIFDIGSWWSHTISIDEVDNNCKCTSVAELLSGNGGSPPESECTVTFNISK